MRVACIGNMNNIMFAMARYLRDVGIDADLLLNQHELPHFHPSWDTFDFAYQKFTKQLEWGRERRLYQASAEKIRADLAPYDFLIACGPIPAFLHKAGRKADVILPYGDDLYRLPFQRQIGREILSFPRAQRRGIRDAALIHTAPYLQPYAERLGVLARTRFLGCPMVYNKIYSPEQITSFYGRSAWYHEFERVRDRFDLMVFHHSRLLWKTFVDETVYKGNEKLIEAFAEFVRRRPEQNAGLVLFEFGIDIEPTRRLIADLKIEEHVAWFPAMARKEILIGLSLCDVSTGQFGFPNFGGGTVYETLAMGKPLIHSRDDAGSTRDGSSDLPPIMNASTASEITAALEAFCDSPATYRAMAKAARGWHDHYVSKSCIDYYAQLIDAKARGLDLGPIVEGLPGRPTA